MALNHVFAREGFRFEGEYKDGRLQGLGTAYYPDGSVYYKGGFKDGVSHGIGTAYYLDGSVAYRGEFKDGQPLD